MVSELVSVDRQADKVQQEGMTARKTEGSKVADRVGGEMSNNQNSSEESNSTVSKFLFQSKRLLYV